MLIDHISPSSWALLSIFAKDDSAGESVCMCVKALVIMLRSVVRVRVKLTVKVKVKGHIAYYKCSEALRV